MTTICRDSAKAPMKKADAVLHVYFFDGSIPARNPAIMVASPHENAVNPPNVKRWIPAINPAPRPTL